MKKLNKKGISLAEMIAVLAISGIISAMLSLFAVQTAKTVATHKANNNIITEVAFLFREIENQIDNNKNFDKNILFGDNPSAISKITNDDGSESYVVSLGGHIYPSHYQVKFSNISITKDAVSSQDSLYDLYVVSVTADTLDNDSALKSKTFTTSFLVRK